MNLSLKNLEKFDKEVFFFFNKMFWIFQGNFMNFPLKNLETFDNNINWEKILVNL